MFVDDIEKMCDFIILDKNNFLLNYSYLTQQEYKETGQYFQDNKIDVLSDMYRQAENYYIEELNNRPTGLNINSETIKNIIVCYIKEHFTTIEEKEFYEIIESMGC